MSKKTKKKVSKISVIEEEQPWFHNPWYPAADLSEWMGTYGRDHQAGKVTPGGVLRLQLLNPPKQQFNNPHLCLYICYPRKEGFYLAQDAIQNTKLRVVQVKKRWKWFGRLQVHFKDKTVKELNEVFALYRVS